MLKNFVEESCTGTGDLITLTGATVGNITFLKSLKAGQFINYVIEDLSTSVKVSGIGIFNAANNTILRSDRWQFDGTNVIDNPVSNITLSGATNRIRCDITAESTEILSRIDDSITATAKEVYIYDTSKDIIDWRHNENASWYNEPLNTATRGATREFPAVVLIVATDTEFTIYDATNPLLLMWAVVNAVNGWTQGTYHVVSPTIAKISAENGVICVARGSVSIGTDCFDFVNDSITMFYTSLWGGESGVNIAGRNGTTYYKQNSPTGFVGIVGSAKSLLVTHDKLGNTLIYIGFTGGLVRIEGTSSYSPTSVWAGGSQPTVTRVSSLARNGDNILIAIDNSDHGKHISSYSVDAKLNNTFDYLTHRKYVLDVALWNLSLTPLAINGVISIVRAINKNAIATNNQLILTKPNPSSFGLGLHATITSSFNSGYQYGDIKGAWLADTLAGTVTGGTVADRSHNNSPLTVNGTLTKTAVNTGCELVWFNYSLAQTAATAATGYIEWWEEVAGVPTKYVKNLAGTGDYVNGRAGTVSSSVSIAGGTLTINAGVNITLLRVGNGFPTVEQIAHSYNQEKHLFNLNTACTLAGTSDDCKAVDYDSAKDLHHVATTTNKSVFKGLVRVSSKVGAFTTVSAQNDYVAEG